MSSGIKIFSYLPNPRVWKALIAANLCDVKVEVVGDEPKNLPNWLWDIDARQLTEDDKANSALIRKGRRGFTNDLYKTNEFLLAHPFGTVPAAFDTETRVGIFESNSIMRAVARLGKSNNLYGGDNDVLASRIDSFLDASLVFSREHQVYILGVQKMNKVLHNRMKSSYEFYLDGIERALEIDTFIVGNQISLADISFFCDTGYFLKEANYRDILKKQGFNLISSDFKEKYPLIVNHLNRLAKEDEFRKVANKEFMRF